MIGDTHILMGEACGERMLAHAHGPVLEGKADVGKQQLLNLLLGICIVGAFVDPALRLRLREDLIQHGKQAFLQLAEHAVDGVRVHAFLIETDEHVIGLLPRIRVGALFLRHPDQFAQIF